MNLNNKNTNKEGAQNITKTDQNNENKKGSLERPEGSKNGLGYPPGIINFQNPSHSGSPDKYPNQPAGAPGQSTAPGYPAYPTYPAYPSSAGYYPPPFFPRRPLEPYGVAAGTMGIVAMAIFWLSIFPGLYGTIFFAVIITISVLGMIFGAYSYANRLRRNISGLVGLILSIIATVLSSLIWSFSHYDYYYDRYEIILMLINNLKLWLL
jgi:hypothetical protein